MDVFTWLYNLIQLVGGLLMQLFNFIEAGLEACIAIVSGFVTAPTQLLVFFDAPAFAGTALLGFSTIVLIGIGLLVLRLVVNLL